MLGGIGLPELIVIFLVILLLFGSKALPEVAKGLAQAIRTFKKEVKEIKGDLSDDSAAEAKTESKSSEAAKDTSNDFNSESKRRDWRPEEKA